MIAIMERVEILDVLQLNEYLKKEGYAKGIILTAWPYDNRVKEELQKPNKRIEILITDEPKEKRKSLTKELKAQGFAVKHR